MIEAHHHDLAAVIMEPFQRLIVPQPGFLHGVREITARLGVPLVFDEIVTGSRFAYGAPSSITVSCLTSPPSARSCAAASPWPRWRAQTSIPLSVAERTARARAKCGNAAGPRQCAGSHTGRDRWRGTLPTRRRADVREASQRVSTLRAKRQVRASSQSGLAACHAETNCSTLARIASRTTDTRTRSTAPTSGGSLHVMANDSIVRFRASWICCRSARSTL